MVMIPKKGAPAAGAPAAGAPAAGAPAPAAAGAAAPAPAPAATPAPSPSPAPAAASTAVAPAQSTAVAVAGKPINYLAQNFKNAMPLDWNTLHRLQATQGNFVDLEDNKKPLGSVMTLQLMTFQDNWQISPGTDDTADVQHVRYSDDGKTTKQGEDCAEFLQALKDAGYTEAKMAQRITLAGEILDMPSAPQFVGKLVQMDVATTTKALFDRFQMQSSLDISRKRKQPEDVQVLKLTAKPTSKGNFNWTVVEFDYGVAPAA